MASLKHSTRILYVSDDQDDVFLLQVVAEEAGFHNLVCLSPNGEIRAVMEYLLKESRTELPNVIVVDARIPPCDGFQILKSIREQPRFNQIFISIVTDSEDYLDNLKKHHPGLRADGFLRKPFSVENLEEMHMKFHMFRVSLEGERCGIWNLAVDGRDSQC